MPAITKLDVPTARNSYASLAQEFTAEENEKYCGPISLALLAGITVKESIAICEANGRACPKSGMTLDNLLAAFKEQGTELREISDAIFIAQYPGVHKDLKNVTSHHPRRFPKAFTGRNLLVWCKGHFFAIVNGQTEDWTVNATKRALKIFEVCKAGEAVITPPASPSPSDSPAPANEIIIDLTEDEPEMPSVVEMPKAKRTSKKVTAKAASPAPAKGKGKKK